MPTNVCSVHSPGYPQLEEEISILFFLTLYFLILKLTTIQKSYSEEEGKYWLENPFSRLKKKKPGMDENQPDDEKSDFGF